MMVIGLYLSLHFNRFLNPHHSIALSGWFCTVYSEPKHFTEAANKIIN